METLALFLTGARHERENSGRRVFVARSVLMQEDGITDRKDCKTAGRWRERAAREAVGVGLLVE
jgi:hypothetical protein